MPVTLLTGGARSGKSTLALRLASKWPGPVAFLATAEARDPEMAERIAQHRSERPRAWRTIEEPLNLVAAIADTTDAECLVIDCLTIWVANLLERGDDTAAVEKAAGEASAAAASPARRPTPTIVVTNEVGFGIVPDNTAARMYRDVLGRVNAIWAQAADESALVVAGRIVPLKDATEIGGWNE